MSLTKTEILFIRACKSKNPEYRIKRLYKMFYYPEVSDQQGMLILSKIADKAGIFNGRLAVILDGLNPANAWKYRADSDASYLEIACAFLISEVRLTPVSKFEGFILPAKFRKQGGI